MIVGTSRFSYGSLLLLLHLNHNMNPQGSRAGIVFNGSPLFTGDEGSGESEISRWIIENNWLETIDRLPDQHFQFGNHNLLLDYKEQKVGGTARGNTSD